MWCVTRQSRKGDAEFTTYIYMNNVLDDNAWNTRSPKSRLLHVYRMYMYMYDLIICPYLHSHFSMHDHT